MRRVRVRHRGVTRGSMAVSIFVHVLAAVALWGAQALQNDPVLYETIEIRVVSAPPTPTEVVQEEPPAPEEELVVETPEEELPVPEEEAPVVVEEEEPEPEPEETPPPPVEEMPPPAEEPPAPTESEAEPSEEEGGEDINVRLEGLRRDYPAYYANIIVQIRRCFRPPDGQAREATIRFLIHRDGSTSDFATVSSSGSFAFDAEAQGAVECAGRPGRIGPLPEDFPSDVLPIQFRFSPGSG